MSADWIKTAVVGQRVVCVNARGFADVIQSGKEYTIRLIYEDEGVVYVALVGVCESSADPGFLPSRFRPVEPRKTDISWAHDILKSVSEPADNPIHEVAQ